MAKICWSNEFLSFLRSPVGSGAVPKLTKMTAVFNVMSTIMRPTDKDMTVLDQAFCADKLHDGEPAAVIDELERRWPTFFFGLPERGGVTEKKKGQFLSRFITIHLHGGEYRYQKPTRQKNGLELVTMT